MVRKSRTSKAIGMERIGVKIKDIVLNKAQRKLFDDNWFLVEKTTRQLAPKNDDRIPDLISASYYNSVATFNVSNGTKFTTWFINNYKNNLKNLWKFKEKEKRVKPHTQSLDEYVTDNEDTKIKDFICDNMDHIGNAYRKMRMEKIFAILSKVDAEILGMLCDGYVLEEIKTRLHFKSTQAIQNRLRRSICKSIGHMVFSW